MLVKLTQVQLGWCRFLSEFTTFFAAKNWRTFLRVWAYVCMKDREGVCVWMRVCIREKDKTRECVCMWDREGVVWVRVCACVCTMRESEYICAWQHHFRIRLSICHIPSFSNFKKECIYCKSVTTSALKGSEKNILVSIGKTKVVVVKAK